MTDKVNQTTERDCQLPCGCCDAGIYAAEAVAAGVEMFGKCHTRREALRAAPRCKHEGRKVCMGARDFILAMTFPIDREAVLKKCANG